MTRLRCPQCGQSVQIPESPLERTVSCSECDAKISIGARAAAPAARRSAMKKPEPDEELETDDRPATPAPARKVKRKKNKKKAKEFNPVHIILAVAGVLVVLAATGVFYLIQHGAFSKPKLDPEQVLAELKQMDAMVRRDEDRPDRPVTIIRISAERYDPRVLNKLVVFPELHYLDLSSTLTTDIWLEHLRDVTSLRQLSLSHTKVSGGGMEYLKNMVNLEELNLDQTLVTDASLEQLKGLTKLKKIHLDGTLASGLGLQGAIPGLQVIK